jgi:hypothetical protein
VALSRLGPRGHAGAECGDVRLLSEVRNLCGQSGGLLKRGGNLRTFARFWRFGRVGAATSVEEELTEGS